MKHFYLPNLSNSSFIFPGRRAGYTLFAPKPFQRICLVLGFILSFAGFLSAQNSLNSGDFSTGSWGSGQAMSASAGSSLIITKAVSSSGDKYFRFYGDGSPCGEYQPDNNGDYFTHDVVVTSPNANCGSTNAWRVNVPTSSSNVVFKTDGGNDGIDRSIAFVIQGAVQSVSSVARSPSGNVFPGQDVVVTATLSADFSTGQAAWLRYTNDAFSTSTVVKMTGSGTTRTATIPGATNTPSTAVAYYIFTSSDGSSISGADADFYTINLNNNGGSNYSYTTQAGWTTAATGNWSTAGTWTANAVPPTATNMGTVTVGHAITLNQSALVGSVVLNTATANILTLAASQTLSIAAGGSITRSSTATLSANASSTVRFLGNGSIGWANTWGNLETGGTLTITGSTVQTITTSFQINSGGSISFNPTYTATSTLVYNSGGSYGVGNEWTATTDGVVAAGRPQNVTIQNSTTLNMTTTTRAMVGNLTISSGTLALNGTSGDLILRGNWSNSGTFTPSGRAVFFMGGSTTTISKTGGETFDYLVLQKSGAFNIQLLSNVTVAASSGGVLQLLNTVTGGGVDLNGFDLTLSGTGGSLFVGNAAALVRNISGTGNLYITNGTKTVSRNALAAGTLTLATGVNVQLSNGLDFGAALTTLNGTLTINSGGFVSTNTPIYGASSALVYNSGGSYGVSTEWTATADGAAGSGLPNNVTIQNATTLNMPAAARAMAGNLSIGSTSTFNLNATSGDFSLRGNWVNAGGTFNHNNRFVVFRGIAAATTVEKTGGNETFYELRIDKGAGAFNLQFNSHITISSATGSPLQMLGTITAGSGINLNGFNLTLSGAGGNFDLGAGTALVRNVTGTGNVYFNGAKTITRTTSNTVTFGASVVVQLSAAVTFNAASIATVNGTLQLNSGGSVVTNPPLYGSASFLIYNQTGSLSVGSEWTSNVTTAPPISGRPVHVTIQNSTTMTMPTTARAMYGNLSISSGTLGMSGTGGADLTIVGNWNNSGTFTPNSRTVIFSGGTASSITNASGETFAGLTLTKTSGIAVNLASNVTVAGLLTFTTGTLAIGSNTLNLNGTTSGSSVTNGLSGTANSTLNVGGSTNALGNLAFVTGSQRLGSLTLNRTGIPSGTMGFGMQSNLVVDNGSGLNNSNLTLTDGILMVGNGFTLTVANTSITGNSGSFVATQLTTGRFAYTVTGAGTYTLNFPIGDNTISSPTAHRPLVLTNLIQTGTNTYTVASYPAAGGAGSGVSTYTSPIVGVSTVRYYPLMVTTPANLTSIASVSLILASDETPTLDVLAMAQVSAGSWKDIGMTGSSIRTSTGTIDVSSATTYFAFGYTAITTIYFGTGGSDANSGETNALRKLTFPAAISAVTNGGTVLSTSTVTAAASGYTISKNINFNTSAGALTLPAGANPTITAKAVHPFVPAGINTGTDAITVTSHQLVTGIPVTYENYGEAIGFMPSDINTGTDVLTIGSNIATGQPVIYQAYDGSAAGGLTHGTTYYAINNSATSIKLAASYSDALAGTPVVDLTSTGSALSHGVISSVAYPLVFGTLYYVILVDANTIKLATTNANALAGTAIDLVTSGGGNHVVYFTPTFTGTFTSSATVLNISEPQAHIKSFYNLTSTSNLSVNLVAGTYSMQPTIPLNRTNSHTITGAGMGTTIIDGKGKISSTSSYYGFNFGTTASLVATSISNLKVTGYYYGINRNSTFSTNSIIIDNVESSDNFSRGANFEGSGALNNLTIRNGTYSNNNGVGVSSYGINVSGMAKININIRNNVVSGNRNSGIEIGSGTTSVLLVRGNSVSGATTVSPLVNGVTEYGIGITQTVAPAGTGSGISDNSVQMYGRAGIECRGCIGNGATSGAGSFRIASNYVNQAGGPFTTAPGTSNTNEIRDIAGIAVGNLQSGTNANLMVVDTNQVTNINQPNSVSSAYTAFGIVTGGTSIVHRCNIVSGCEIGMQAQQGAPGNENNTPDDYYSKDNSATTTSYLANRNSITTNSVFGARNQVSGTINFEGNWWGQQDGPTQANNTAVAGYPAGTGENLPSGTGIAYNGFMGKDPDENVGTASGQRGIQATSGKNFRLKPTANATSLAAPYVINQGINVGFGNNNSTYPDTLDIYPATYSLPTESIKILRSMYLRGNFGSGTQPIIQGTGNSVHPVELSGTNGRMLINIASRNSGVENLNLKVNVPAFIISPSMAFGIGDTILVATLPLSGVKIKNNLIENTGSYNFTSYGIYFRSVNQSSEAHVFEISGNSVGTVGSGFGAPIRIWGGRGNVFGNTCTGAYPFRWGTVTIGGGTSNIYNNTFNGGVELNSPQSGTTNVYKNTFNRNSSTAHVQSLEVRLNRQVLGAVVNVDSNTFNNIGQSGYPYWGILSMRNTNITVTRNFFNAAPTATDFAFIHASTRQQGTLANPAENFDNSLVVKGNSFIGNSAVATNKVGISFARHRGSQTFGTITIGGTGSDTNSFSGLNRYFELDPLSGALFDNTAPASTRYTPTNTVPYAALGSSDNTAMTQFDVNFDASQNKYEVGGVKKLPSVMTVAEHFELEDKIQHAIDYGSLGFVTVKANEAFVTNNSYLTGYTATPAISRAVTEASDGWKITAETDNYNETVTVNKTLTFANDGTTVIQNLTMNGAGKTLTLDNDFEVSNGGTLTLTNGLIATGSNTLRVTNPATGGISGGSAASHVTGNLNRAVATSTDYSFTVGNGTDYERMILNFASQSGLTDVTVNFTNTPPGTNVSPIVDYEQILQDGYWIVTPNVGTTTATYSMRLYPTNFTNYPTGLGGYTILKRVGAGSWHEDGTHDPADDLDPSGVWTDNSISRSGIVGFSNFGVGGSIDVPLPIRLGSFLANRKKEDVYLNWKTFSELNVKQTDVERSKDGSVFQTISTVSSKSEKGALYQHVDLRPFSPAVSTLYYRLKFTDYTGKVEYSEVRLVRDQFASDEVTLYPNPVADRLIFSPISNQNRVTVIDQLGRKVISDHVVTDGMLDVSHLPPGIYQLLLRMDSDTKLLSFVKK